MNNLYDIIRESRGVVTGINSWTKTIDYILSSGKDYIDKELAPWMYDVHVERENGGWLTGHDVAMYDDDKSSVIDGKMSIYITLYDSGLNVSNILQHEFQHAFDDWIARTRRGMKNEMTDKYCIGTGYEYEEAGPLALLTHPKQVTCDEFFCMFKQCTYFFEPTEVNAFSREFSIYLDNNTLDFNEMLDDPKIMNDCGAGPLVWVNLLYNIKPMSDQYIEDEDHVDYSYIVQGLHDKWSKRYLGKNIQGNTPKDIIMNTIQYIIKNKCNYVIKKFKRIINDHPNKVKNIPFWLR